MKPEEVPEQIRQVAFRALARDGESLKDLEFGSSSAPSIVDPSPLDHAYSSARVGRAVPGSRFFFFKRVALRIARLITGQQTDFNFAIVEAVKQLSLEIERRVAAQQAAMTSVELLATEVRGHLERFQDVAQEAGRTFEESERRLAFDRTELARVGTLVDSFMEEARKRLPETFDSEQLERFALPLEDALDSLYDEFESLFRGSRDEIRDRQREFLGDVKGVDSSGRWVDVGSGRGEWLELLNGEGVGAYGVDSNSRFVDFCRAQGLEVVHGDAIEHLRSLPDSSIGGVTAFHLIEHLPFTFLVSLLDEALRVLQPGGLLLLETPNPTNIIVGSSSFYLDPTHRNPLHPHLMEFLLKARGFGQVELRFLHPSTESPFKIPALKGAEWGSISRVIEYLNGALFGPLDYAVLGTKASASI